MEECQGCFWLQINEDLRPCRGCDNEHNQYVTEEELDKVKYECYSGLLDM